jgi:hypothetical protein
MEKLEIYRDIIQEILVEYSQNKPAYTVRTDLPI